MCIHGEEKTGAGWVREPFTGRLRREVIPGVFRTRTFGNYDRAAATIRLFGYLCEPANLGPLALYFKVRALQTLLHEAGHHFDFTFRTGRSRWDVGDKQKLEDWAEKAEIEQATEVIVPYVRQRYPAECDELAEWIREHGGVALPVPAFLLENRAAFFGIPADVRESLWSQFGVDSAFVDLMRSALSGRDRKETRVAFARDLHEEGCHDYAREILRGVLESCPEDAEALAVSACICQCDGEDFETGESLCLRAIAADPGCVAAWTNLVRNYWQQKRYQDVVRTCERALSRLGAGDDDGLYFCESLVESHILLKSWADAEASIARLRAWGSDGATPKADVYVVVARCWQEQWEEARHLASSLLSSKEHEPWRLWLSAAVFESAHRLGRPREAGVFGELELGGLRCLHFTRPWAERIKNCTKKTRDVG